MNDKFRIILGDDPRIEHEPCLEGERGPLRAVYSICHLKSGEVSRDFMTAAEVDKIRAKSRAQKGPWADPTFYPEMAKKTVAKRHAKQLPTSADLDDLLRRDDHLYDLEGQATEVKEERRGQITGGKAMLDRFVAGDLNLKVDPETGEVLDVADKPKTRARKAKESTEQASVNAAGTDDSNAGDEPAQISTGEARGEPEPLGEAEAVDTAPQRLDAPAVAEIPINDETKKRAFERGRASFHKNMKRAATPPEYRSEHNAPLITAWQEGWDAENLKKS